MSSVLICESFGRKLETGLREHFLYLLACERQCESRFRELIDEVIPHNLSSHFGTILTNLFISKNDMFSIDSRFPFVHFGPQYC